MHKCITFLLSKDIERLNLNYECLYRRLLRKNDLVFAQCECKRCRLKKPTLAVQETGIYRYNRVLIKGPLKPLSTIDAVMVRGNSGGLSIVTPRCRETPVFRTAMRLIAVFFSVRQSVPKKCASEGAQRKPLWRTEKGTARALWKLRRGAGRPYSPGTLSWDSH